MFELIYKVPSVYGVESLLYRSKSYNNIIDVCTKYKIPFRDYNLYDNLTEGFYVRELIETPLNEIALNNYLEYFKDTEWKRR